MELNTLEMIFSKLTSARIGVVGDFCLDAYWTIDAAGAEPSVETGHATRAVCQQHYALGGAGSVADNLTALGTGSVLAFGVLGDDVFGREMQRLMAARQMDTAGMIVQPTHWQTNTYAKPISDTGEEQRLDFGYGNTLATATASAILAALTGAITALDVLIINQQVATSIHADKTFRAGLQTLIHDHPEKVFLLDSRDYCDIYAGTIRKLNAHEATTLCGETYAPLDTIPRATVETAAATLTQKWQQSVYITCGANGAIMRAVDASEAVQVRGLHLIGALDTVGAGDGFLAGIAAASATGHAATDGLALGNFIAGITVQKRRQTGTASPAEIRTLAADPDYIYNPELAANPRRAEYLADSEIEIVRAVENPPPLAYAIFDHDGTISVLRQGWEAVMEPMMMHAILGAQHDTTDDGTFQMLQARAREFIDQTTGIQTLIQMRELAVMVREMGYVPAAEILDEHGYKAIYNKALLEMVASRAARLKRGELGVLDYTMKNAVRLLEYLHEKGVRLYLASGTDEVDVKAEATAMGYAELFTGGIFGAVGDINREAKREVLDRIAADVGAANMASLVTIGDGPVEIRETHKRGGRTIGIASNEMQRHGLDRHKRSRLIRAGADIIVPDFSQMDALLSLFALG